jgi:hypothetical protein
MRKDRENMALCMETATGIKGYPGIAKPISNGSHNVMANDACRIAVNGRIIGFWED